MKTPIKFIVAILFIPVITFSQEFIPVFGQITNQFSKGRSQLQITFTYMDGEAERDSSFETDANGYYEGRLPVSIGNDWGEMPYDFTLLQNYPNPFNSHTIIPFTISKPGITSLQIYNIRGQLVKNIIHRQVLDPQLHHYYWDGSDSHGNGMPAGIYICRLTTGRSTQSIKIALIDGGGSGSRKTRTVTLSSLNSVDEYIESIEKKYHYRMASADDMEATVSIRDLNEVPDHRSSFRERDVVADGRDSLNFSVVDHLINTQRFSGMSIESDYTFMDNQLNENQGNWNRWHIQGNLYVRNNATLTIPSGSMMFMFSGADLKIQNGRVNMDGDSWRNRILFKPEVDNDEEYYWGKIEFDSQALVGSIIEYVEITKATVGLEFDGCDNDFTVENCYIWNCKERGIVIDTDDGQITVIHCKITENYYQNPDNDVIIGFGILIGDGNPAIGYCNFFDSNPVTGNQNYVHISVNNIAVIQGNNFASNGDGYHAYRHCVWSRGGRDEPVDGRNNWWGEANVDPTRKVHRNDWTCLSDDPGNFVWDPVLNQFSDDAGIQD